VPRQSLRRGCQKSIRRAVVFERQERSNTRFKNDLPLSALRRGGNALANYQRMYLVSPLSARGSWISASQPDSGWFPLLSTFRGSGQPAITSLELVAVDSGPAPQSSTRGAPRKRPTGKRAAASAVLGIAEARGRLLDGSSESAEDRGRPRSRAGPGDAAQWGHGPPSQRG